MTHRDGEAVLTSVASTVTEFCGAVTLLELFHIFRMTATGGKL